MKINKGSIFRGLKFTLKWGYKLLIAAAGGAAITTNPVAGLVTISSVISAAIKDKRFKPVIRLLINIMSVNIGNAKNDPVLNETDTNTDDYTQLLNPIKKET